jgi:hypothetical protein
LVSSVLLDLTSKFNIKKGPTPWEVRVFSEDGKEIAEIKKGEELEFRLLSKKGNQQWVLTNKIDGEHRRFSFSVREVEKQEGQKDALLTVRDNIFKHNGKFYMLASHPEGKSWHNYVSSPVRYISRLDNFPYSDVSEMDENKHHKNLRLLPAAARFMRRCMCTEMVWPTNWNWPYSEVCCRLGKKA